MLSELGVRIGIAPEIIERSLREANIGFMTAQAHHGAMAHVAPVRRELGARTLFNLLGPLSNPAGVRRALIGVFSEAWMEPIAETLKTLGAEKVWIVHGADGLDEISTTGPTKVLALENGAFRRFEINPEEVGLTRSTLDDLRGGDPACNAAALRAVLAGREKRLSRHRRAERRRRARGGRKGCGPQGGPRAGGRRARQRPGARHAGKFDKNLQLGASAGTQPGK